ncbi:MAG: cytochrome c oxidase assembly protein [Rhizobiaceae bacterium]|nr:cytochrome c oxidase assembly protein [Rhizobiaceae bacterium]
MRPQDRRLESRNRTVAVALGAFFFCMIGAAYAAVPLYQLFCQVTGYGGTTQRVTQYSDRVLDREITVHFDANTSSGLPWAFRPVQREVTMKIGETTQIAYEAENLARTPSSGRATFNVTPQIAGSYFMKVECFCFTDTTLKPGEKMEMPVVFYVDPEIVDAPELKNIHTITLSYTFYPGDAAEPVAAASRTGAEGDAPAGAKIGG